MAETLSSPTASNKPKLLDQVRDASRQAGSTEQIDRLSRELRERYPNYAGG